MYFVALNNTILLHGDAIGMEVDDMYTENEHEEAESEENVSSDNIYFKHLLLCENHNFEIYIFFCLFLLLQGLCDVVDTTALVRSCVQAAVGMLRDQVESGMRSTRRVEILLTLLSDNDEVKGTNNNCFCVFAVPIMLINAIIAHHVI